MSTGEPTIIAAALQEEGASAGRLPPIQRERRIPEIESLRGIAITLVFLLHADSWVTFRPPGQPGALVSPLRAFMNGGHTGVSLFFVISAFLLGRPFLAEAAGGARVNRVVYFRRRALRILPLYSVVVSAAAIACARGPADWRHAVPYLFFMNSFADMVVPLLPYSNVWWSLATEVQFYLLLPLLPLFLRSRRGWYAGAITLVGYAVFYGAFITHRYNPLSPEGYVRLSHSVLGRGPLFGWGLAAAWLSLRFGDDVRAWARQAAAVRVGVLDAALVLGVVSMAYLLRAVTRVGYWSAEAHWHAWHILEGGLWAAVLLLIVLLPLHAKPLLCNRFWAAIGTRSYSIYLLHSPMIVFVLAALNWVWPGRFMGWNFRTGIAIPLAAVLTLALATITYAGLERPFLKYGRRALPHGRGLRR